MKLTQTQLRALKICSQVLDWECSYSLRIPLGTLRALDRRGLLCRRAGIGSMFSPQTGIEFLITAQGKRLIAELAPENSLVSAGKGSSCGDVHPVAETDLTAQHSELLGNDENMVHAVKTQSNDTDDVCALCGDQRKFHDENGCQLCRTQGFIWQRSNAGHKFQEQTNEEEELVL